MFLCQQFAQHIELPEDDLETMETSDNNDILMLEANNNIPKSIDNNFSGAFLPNTQSPASSSDSELASVNRIIDATDPQHFQSFFLSRSAEEAVSETGRSSRPQPQLVATVDNNSSSNDSNRILPVIKVLTFAFGEHVVHTITSCMSQQSCSVLLISVSVN